MTINREATIRWKGYDPNDLKPHSNKRVWANCDKCGDGRWIYKYAYKDLCCSCVANTDKARSANTSRQIQYHIDHPEKGETQSKWMKKYLKDNPEVLEKMLKDSKDYWDIQSNRDDQSEKRIEYFKINPEAGKEQGKKLRNSEAMQIEHERQRGGDDIVGHHHIYDHDDLSKYTIKMTRSQHAILHNTLRALGLKVPHINTGHENEDELKLMEYIKKIESEQKTDNGEI